MGADDGTNGALNSVEVALATLQPIRDLAKNWDIDIATCLEEYLHELIGGLTQEQRRRLPQQAESLNFSQAALVLQNSSNVYSRKVEYLYNLVYKALEELNKSTAGNKDGGGGNGGRKSSADAAIDEFNNYDPHVDFLLLDDVLPMDKKGTKINLPEEEDGDGGRRGYDPGLSFATAATTTRLSLGGTMSATTATERSAMMVAQSTAQQVLLRALDMGSLHLLDGRCDVGEDGVLLMPGTAPAPGLENNYNGIDGGVSHSPATSLHGELALHQGDIPDDAVMGGDGYDDDDNDGPGYAFADDDDGGDQPMAAESTENFENTATPKRGTSSKFRKTNDPVPPKMDPWALLDPHSQGTTSKRTKPLRVGKTLKLPPGVQSLPSATSNERYATTRLPTTEKSSKIRGSLAMACFKARLEAFKHRTEKGQRRPDSDDDDSIEDDVEGKAVIIPMKGLMYGSEFMYIAKATARRKKVEQQDERKRFSKLTHSEVEEEPEEDNDEDTYVPFDFGGGGDDDSVGGIQLADDDGLGNTGFATVDTAFAHEGDADDVSNSEGKTFEELCRAHIQAFARGAEAYAAETRLSKRVGLWHEKLMPILEDEENRPEFDIHAYSRRVISSIEEEVEGLDASTVGAAPTKVVDFHAVTRNCHHYDVCRLFLASLSLSNSGNVKLVHDGGADVSSLGITLLNNQIDRPMETYLAPSVFEEV